MIEYVVKCRNPKLALQQLFEVLMRDYFIPFGKLDLVRSPQGNLLGASLWSPPNEKLTIRRQLRMLPDLVKALGLSLPRAWRLSAMDSDAKPRFPHWYLFVIAASPAARGQGVGGRLLDHGIERAGSEAIYLESTGPRSQALYERKGFIPLGVIPSTSPAPEVGMWKPGQVG